MKKLTIGAKNALPRFYCLLWGMLVIACFSFLKAKAQAYLPKIIPSSPEASTLFRSLDYPVNHSTGVPEISIPVYEIKTGTLSLPISISYHASGRRATDETGPVGLGWSLNAGGMISRVIYGRPDDLSYFPPVLKPSGTLTNQNDYEYLKSLFSSEMSSSVYDSEYDIFSYHFPGNTGKFVLNGERDSVYLLPLKPIKISPGGFPSTIIDDKGITYNFDLTESYGSDPSYPTAITGKLLTSIISANKEDTISFFYKSFRKISSLPTETYTVIDDNSTDQTHSPKTSVLNTQQRQYTIQRLVEIKFRGASVKFNLDGTSDRVNSIQIIRTDGFYETVLRTIRLQMSPLDHAWPLSSVYNYKLDELQFIDRNNQLVERYAFEYTPTEDFNPYSRDYWGYRNGTDQGRGVPTYNVEFINYPGNVGTTSVGSGANRTSSDFMQRGVLRKIFYPTGASTEFTYEVNRVRYGNDIFPGPGLRVAQIKSTDNNGLTTYKTYKYGVNESGYGSLLFHRLEMGDMSYETRFVTGTGTASYPGYTNVKSYRKRIYLSDPLPEISEIVNEPVFYAEVAEYTGTPVSNIGKTVYKYQSPSNGSSNSSLGYYPGPSFFATDPYLRRLCVGQYNLWNYNPLIEKTVYRNAGNNTYQPVEGTFYYYNSTVTQTLRGTHIYKYLYIPEDTYNSEKYAAEGLGMSVFLFTDYEVTVGKEELVDIIKTDYTESGNISNSTTYKYNSNHLLSEIIKVSSKGPQLITKNKYPFDFISDSVIGAVSQTMITRNMLNFIIEQSLYKGTEFLRSAKTSYKNWNGGIIAPEVIETKEGNASGDVRARFDAYDNKGNVLSASKQHDAKVSYIWDYNKRYPIAEVTNAVQSDIAYTSFETLDKGNWEFYNNPFNSTEDQPNIPSTIAISGGRLYNMQYAYNGGIKKTGLDVNKEYTLTFWYRYAEPVLTVNGIIQRQIIATKDDWKLLLVRFKGASVVQLPQTDFDSYIDELSLHPSNAVMQTYIYDPFIGMTSQSDIGRHLIYYDYDGFGRLKTVRDQNGKILRQHDYQYQRPVTQ